MSMMCENWSVIHFMAVKGIKMSEIHYMIYEVYRVEVKSDSVIQRQM